MTPEDHRKSLEASARFREAFLKRRIEAAARGHSATPVPTTRMYVLEDPDKFAPGDVVVEDGKRRRMLIAKIVAGFAECVWFERSTIAPITAQGHRFTAMQVPHTEIVHTSMLTRDSNQKWVCKTLFVSQTLYDACLAWGLDVSRFVVNKTMPPTEGSVYTVEHKLPSSAEMRAAIKGRKYP